MAEIFEAEIDLAAVYTNLQASGEAETMSEVLQVLHICGFVPQEDGRWRCRKFSLGYLDAGELRESRRVA